MASNFDFLKTTDKELFSIITDSEKLFRDEYFNQCAVQLRIFAEKTAKKVLGKTQKEMTFVPPRVTRIITGVVNIMAAFIIPSSSAAPDWSFGSTIRTSERPLGVVPVAVP